IGIDLHQEIAADNHWLGFRMIDIGGNHCTSTGNFSSNKFWRDVVGDVRAEVLTIPRNFFVRSLAAKVLADGDKLHLRRDDASPRIGKLRDSLAMHGAPRSVPDGKLWSKRFPGGTAVIFRARHAACVGFGVPSG